MNEKRIIEAKLAAEVASNALNTCFSRINSAKTNVMASTYLVSMLGLLAWFDFIFPQPSAKPALFVIPFVLAGASRWLVGIFYLRNERTLASSAYRAAMKRSIDIEREELGKAQPADSEIRATKNPALWLGFF